MRPVWRNLLPLISNPLASIPEPDGSAVGTRRTRFIDNLVWKSRQGPEVGSGEEKTSCCLAVAEGWEGILTRKIDQLELRNRRKCLFKRAMRHFKLVALASWQSH